MVQSPVRKWSLIVLLLSAVVQATRYRDRPLYDVISMDSGTEQHQTA